MYSNVIFIMYTSLYLCYAHRISGNLAARLAVGQENPRNEGIVLVMDFEKSIPKVREFR